MPGRKFLPLLLLLLFTGALMTWQVRKGVPAVISIKPLNGFVYGSLGAAEHAWRHGEDLLARLGSGKKDKRIHELEQEVSRLKSARGDVCAFA